MVQAHSRILARDSRWTRAFGLNVIAALALWLSIAAISPGYVGDINQYKAWAKWVTRQGVENAYNAEALRINYPPGSLYLLAAVGHLYETLVDPSFDQPSPWASQLLTWLIKLPAILFHLAAAVAVFMLVRQAQGGRLAWLAGTVLLFDPAAMFDVAHWGQSDPVHALFSLLAVAALSANRSVWAGVMSALAALAKPQSWVLLPLIGAIAWRNGGWRGLARCGLGGAVALLVGLAPFIVNDRLGQLARLPEYMSTHALASHVISANAHNFWWLPTLARGRFIDDLEPLVGPLPYRWVGAALVGLVLLACLAQLLRRNRRPNFYLLAAALGAGWFFFTPRAHENYSFFVLPLLAVAWPSRPRLFGLYVLASVALLANLALEDPLLVGTLSAAGATGEPVPGWFVGLTLLNVALFFALTLGLARALVPMSANGNRAAWPERARRGEPEHHGIV